MSLKKILSHLKFILEMDKKNNNTNLNKDKNTLILVPKDALNTIAV